MELKVFGRYLVHDSFGHCRVCYSCSEASCCASMLADSNRYRSFYMYSLDTHRIFEFRYDHNSMCVVSNIINY